MDDGLNSYLQNRYNASPADPERAAIVAFKAMGGVDYVENSVVGIFCQIFARSDGAPGATDLFNAAAANGENSPRNYGGKDMTFVAEVKTLANDLLSNAADDNMAFDPYMRNRYVPYKGPLVNNTLLAVQFAAKSLGLGRLLIPVSPSK